jgi:hypothetical protein
VIFYYKEDIDLFPLMLGSVPDFKRCNCPDTTLINSENQCSKCAEDRQPNYLAEGVRESIKQARIEGNSEVMVDMLDILSNLQKMKTDQVVKIIEKLFIESYGKDKYEKIKPAFDILQFVVFNLVENYDYVKLTRIFFNFLKKTVGVDMNLVELLMLYLLKDNFMVCGERYHAYNFLTTTSIYKRQIFGKGDSQKGLKHLVRYLSLSTAFWSGEAQIGDDLITEIQSEMNLMLSEEVKFPKELVSFLMHFPLYFTRSQAIMDYRVSKHAEISHVSQDQSSTLYRFALMANETVSNKREFEDALKKSRTFIGIQNCFDLSTKELIGIIYLMKGDINNEYFDHVLTLILKRHDLFPYKRHLEIVLWLIASQDINQILQAMEIFATFTGGNETILASMCCILSYLKGSAVDETQISQSVAELFTNVPTSPDIEPENLQSIVTDCILKRNLSKFKSFKQNLLYLSRPKSQFSTKSYESEFDFLLDLIELLFDFSCGTDIQEMLIKMKELLPEFEATTVFNFTLKLLRTIFGFRNSNRDIVSERLKEAFTNLGEVTMCRVTDFEKLWVLIYSADIEPKLTTLGYFLNSIGQESFKMDDNFRYHAFFIDKKATIIRNKINFMQKLIDDSSSNSTKFGASIIKRLFVKHSKVDLSEICMLLGAVATKLMKVSSQTQIREAKDPDLVHSPYLVSGKEHLRTHNKSDKESQEEVGFNNLDQNSQFRMENFKATRFYVALMDYIVNQDSTSLANYFLDDHDEPILKVLVFCRYCTDPNEVINKIFDQLIRRGETRICSVMYFYFIVNGLVQRSRIDHKAILELEINETIGVKPEFLELIELYIDREQSNFVESIYKIQSRIFYNLNTEIEMQKFQSTEEPLFMKDFYENIVTLIREEQPSITFLSELFKIPLKKLRFIYFLTKLKLTNKFDVIAENFIANQDMVNILERRAINPQELIYLLKICLNAVDYDLITDLLRQMKREQNIIPEILINLLLIDLKVDRDQITPRDFNKNLLLHSAIFDRLGVVKELCWAFCRVLKGDFLSFRELIDILNEDSIPENHRYFSSIMTGMIGIKNSRHYDERMRAVIDSSGIKKWVSLLNQYFTKYKKGLKENSFEYSLYLLFNCQNGFNLHPVWTVMVDTISIESMDRKPPSNMKNLKRLPFLENTSLVDFIALFNLINADELILDFVYDFAYFRNILKYLNRLKTTKDLDDNYSRMNYIIPNIREIVREYKTYMRQLLKSNKLVIGFEHFENRLNATFQGFLMDLCNVDHKIEISDFYTSLNNTVFKKWLKDLQQTDMSKLSQPDSKPARLCKKIKEVFNDSEALMVDPFKMFVTEDNISSKDYWDRKFEELEYLDDYLDCLVEIFMDSLDNIGDQISNIKLTQTSEFEETTMGDAAARKDTAGVHEEESEVSSDSYISEELHAGNVQVRTVHGGSDIMDDENQLSSADINVKWFGLAMYSLLFKLRRYQNLSSDDKSEKQDELFYRSNMLMGFLEKSLFFSTAGNSFKKYMYLSEFNFSMGIRMPTKSWLKYAGSLFMPEILIAIHKKGMLDRKVRLDSTDPKLIFFKCCTVVDIFLNDRNFFKNTGIFAQYTYDASKPGKNIIDNYINLAAYKLECSLVKEIRKIGKHEEDINIQQGFYTLQFWAAPQYKEINSKQRIDIIESKSNNSKGKDEKSKESGKDSTLVSFKLIHGGYYDFEYENEKVKADHLNEISECYFSKKIFKEDNKDNGQQRSGNFSLSNQPKIISYNIKQNFMVFFHDLAIGKYSVLSETKNLFTDDIDLNTHQKIYESILHLHSSKKRFDSNLLKDCLKALSPHLSSNVQNLHSILEFVIEPSKANLSFDELEKASEKDYYLFRELGLKNQTFFHLFLLHTYPKETRSY